MIKCDVCRFPTPMYIHQHSPLENYCSVNCMHEVYTDGQVEWLFDNGFIEWRTQEVEGG